MLRRDSRIVYRSTFRLLTSVPGGAFLAVVSTGAGLTGDPAALVFLPVGIFLVLFALWPRLVVDSHGVTVRNLRSRTVVWSQVKAARVERQLPLLGAPWKWLGRRRGLDPGSGGYPGLVLRTSVGALPVIAVQRQALLQGGFADRVAEQVTAARRAARVGHDPVHAARHAHSKAEAATTQ
ncbi:MAG: hypothetical protein QOF82_3303 [Frankiales bacterium]|nr:hypothetical protein [Frankiales bacterium]